MSTGDEFAYIRDHLVPLTESTPGALGLRDDAAVLAPTPDHEIVLCSDMLVSGVHFLETDAMEQVAERALRTNLSDLAAMGARPIGYLCSVAWPPSATASDRENFAKGLASAQSIFNLVLLGGDTTCSAGPLVISMTLYGEVGTGTALRRDQALAGHDVWVTGTIGDAVLGLSMATGELDHHPALLKRYQFPDARLETGMALNGLASACIDISDGLVADAGHLAATSGVSIEVEATMIPFSDPVLLWLEKEGQPGLESLITGGDDYELLFTAPNENAAAILALQDEGGPQISWIGSVTAGTGVTFRDDMGELLTIESAGFTHF
jgi:thiamine-monophosphate kinase